MIFCVNGEKKNIIFMMMIIIIIMLLNFRLKGEKNFKIKEFLLIIMIFECIFPVILLCTRKIKIF
jgi:hypothetical protein